MDDIDVPFVDKPGELNRGVKIVLMAARVMMTAHLIAIDTVELIKLPLEDKKVFLEISWIEAID
jgi:hypothetical protein